MQCVWDNENGPRTCTVCGIKVVANIQGPIEFLECGEAPDSVTVYTAPAPTIVPFTEQVRADLIDKMRKSAILIGGTELDESRLATCNACDKLAWYGCSRAAQVSTCGNIMGVWRKMIIEGNCPRWTLPPP
jgi:hypothetical protein